MSDDNTIYLTYDFDPKRQHEYQGVYYSHFHGSTLAIGAKMIPEYDKKGLITRVKADFRSEIMGGTINFAIDSVSSVAEFKSGYQLIEIRLNIFTKSDTDFEYTMIEFVDTPYNPKKHLLRISIDDTKIVNLEEGMINPCTVGVNDYRSCNIVGGGGNNGDNGDDDNDDNNGGDDDNP